MGGSGGREWEHAFVNVTYIMKLFQTFSCLPSPFADSRMFADARLPAIIESRSLEHRKRKALFTGSTPGIPLQLLIGEW